MTSGTKIPKNSSQSEFCKESDGLVHCSLKKKEEEEEEHFASLATSWFGTFVMLFHTSRCVVGHYHSKMNSTLL